MPIDYSNYPPDWKETVERIRERSGDKCELCGLKNKSTVYSVPFWIRDNGRYKQRRIWFRSKDDAYRECKDPTTVNKVKVVLTVAHLDHDETNHDVTDDRLMHMCQACHLRYDAEEKYRRACSKYSLF
jgi:hypothetical protein